MAKKVGIGVVGIGGWASTVHLPAYQNHPCARLVGVYDVDGASAEQAARRFGAEAAFSDYGAMLARDDIEAIDIITPNVTHVSLALAAIAAGKHVICEKPMAMNADEAQQMADAAAKASLKTAINFTWRNPRQRCISGTSSSRARWAKSITYLAFTALAGAETSNDPSSGGCRRNSRGQGFWVILARISSIWWSG